jgi:hypothetical protein
MALGNIIDEFHDKNSFTNTGTTEEANFSSFLIWC